MTTQVRLGVTLLRVVVASVFVIHGIWFALVTAAGIGFVVGAGRNGVEYSALIIASLVAVALTDSAGRCVGGRL